MAFADRILPKILHGSTCRIKALVIKRDVVLSSDRRRTGNKRSRANITEIDIDRYSRSNGAACNKQRLHHEHFFKAPGIAEVIEGALHVGNDRRYEVSRTGPRKIDVAVVVAEIQLIIEQAEAVGIPADKPAPSARHGIHHELDLIGIRR